MTATTLPDLAGVIKTTDIYKKMKFDYVAWAKTAQILREHAPGWQFCLEKTNSENELSSYIFKAPNGSGYIMGYFEHIDTKVKSSLFPFAITDFANKAIPFEKISCTDFQNSHRRGLCACACFTFGLAYELWAQIEIEEAAKLPPPPEQGTRGTPTKPNEKLKPVSDKAKNDPPISDAARASINAKLMKFSELHPDEMKKLVAAYKKEFKVSKISPITLARQGEFLSHAISKIDDTL